MVQPVQLSLSWSLIFFTRPSEFQSSLEDQNQVAAPNRMGVVCTWSLFNIYIDRPCIIVWFEKARQFFINIYESTTHLVNYIKKKSIDLRLNFTW